MFKIEDALHVLEENLSSIRNVSEWAYKMGYTKPSKFSWEFREYFGIRPNEVFIEVRIEKIIEYMANHPHEKNYCICLEFGFANEKALYKFLKRHTKSTPTQLRKGITQRDNAKG